MKNKYLLICICIISDVWLFKALYLDNFSSIDKQVSLISTGGLEN